MANTTPSSEEILRRVEQQIKAAEDLLREALANDKINPRLSLALGPIVGLRSLLSKVIDRAANQDVLEHITVYRIIAGECAEFLRLPFDRVYPAVLALCDEDDPDLLAGVGEPDQEVLSSLGRVLLKVSVTYDELEVGKPAGKRAVKLFLFDVNTKLAHERESITELPWEELPEDVREMVLRDDRRTVVFALLPGEGK
jgi:hypothetical protein